MHGSALLVVNCEQTDRRETEQDFRSPEELNSFVWGRAVAPTVPNAINSAVRFQTCIGSTQWRIF